MRLTTNQQHVLSALQQTREPLSAYALLDRLRGAGITAPTQVYRALDRLVQHGLVHRLESLNAYVCCSHPESCTHGFVAFAICERCGSANEFVDRDLDRSLGRWVKNNAFSLRESTIEIRGTCAACAAPA